MNDTPRPQTGTHAVDVSFADFDLDERFLSALNACHFHRPTPVQAQSLPPLLEYRDVLVGAATGTGKTAAFVLPALQRLLDDPKPPKHPRVLMLAPTRELARQTHRVVKQLGQMCHRPGLVITGGMAADQQMTQLKQPLDWLVATPGRLTKLMTDVSVDLSQIEMVIIDEADRMLDAGLGPDVMAILQAIPRAFQAGCFSATLSGTRLANFSEQVLDDPEIIQVNAPNQATDKVQESVYFAKDQAHKRALLLALLTDPSCGRALVFCNKKTTALATTDWLTEQGVAAQTLHGDKIQAKRLVILDKFRHNNPGVLVATDVAARGLDVPGITHVIHYDMPFRGDQYIHRVGRTGRGHQAGLALSLVEHHDYPQLKRIEHHLQTTLPEASLPGLHPGVDRDTLERKPKKPKKPKKSKKLKKSKKIKKTKHTKKPRA